MVASPRGGGLLSSLRALLGSSVGLLRTRLELLAIEAQEEKVRLISLLTFGAAAFVLLSFGLLFLAAFVTVLLWESHRLLALGAFTAVFLAGGIASFLALLGVVRTPSTLFVASLAELSRDQAALHGDAPPQ
jgi:uncharacterized membrane protein YqjE